MSLPIELPLSNTVVEIPEEVLNIFGDAIAAVDRVQDYREANAAIAHEFILSALPTIGGPEWKRWKPAEREVWLIHLLGKVDAQLMQIIMQESDLSPDEIDGDAEDFVTLH